MFLQINYIKHQLETRIVAVWIALSVHGPGRHAHLIGFQLLIIIFCIL